MWAKVTPVTDMSNLLPNKLVTNNGIVEKRLIPKLYCKRYLWVNGK